MSNFDNFIGCDEVGRGPLAGPVVSSAVRVSAQNLKSFKKICSKLSITDSKKLTTKKRLEILDFLDIDVTDIHTEKVYSRDLFDFCLDSKSPLVIDEINILQASLLSMRDSCEPFLGNSFVYIDGNKFLPEQSSEHDSKTLDKNLMEPIVQGDSKNELIALSSIIAKEFRDHMMERFSEMYPLFELEKHAGYPTKRHKELIEKFGPSPIHRKTFKGVREFL